MKFSKKHVAWNFIYSALLALSAVSSAPRADPLTPPPKPQRWESIGPNEVIDPDSIRRHENNIVEVYVGVNFTLVKGEWERTDDGGWRVYDYLIDCKFHTFHEVWIRNWRGPAKTFDGWLAGGPDSRTGLVENRVCTSTKAKKS
jgi:hypothetical protein